MDCVNLGQTGLKVSRICLGMMTYGTSQWRPWILDEADARPVVQRAVELGVNFFDTADMYSAGASEELTGKFLREFTRRDEVVIATKVFFPVDIAFQGGFANSERQSPNTSGLSRKHIFAAVEASLKRLGIDYIDLYQIHRWSPLARGFLAGNRTPDDITAGRTPRSRTDEYARELYYREEAADVVIISYDA